MCHDFNDNQFGLDKTTYVGRVFGSATAVLWKCGQNKESKAANKKRMSKMRLTNEYFTTRSHKLEVDNKMSHIPSAPRSRSGDGGPVFAFTDGW